MNKMRVKDYMTEEVVTIDRDATLHDAIEKMLEHNIHGLMVVESSGRPAGIVTTDDILALMNNGEPEGDTVVSEFMEAAIVTIDPDYDLQRAVSIMIRNKIHRLPVIKDHRLLGMITSSDIMRAYKTVKLAR